MIPWSHCYKCLRKLYIGDKFYDLGKAVYCSKCYEQIKTPLRAEAKNSGPKANITKIREER